MDEIRDIEIEDNKDKEININQNEKETKNLLKERKFQDNIKVIN